MFAADSGIAIRAITVLDVQYNVGKHKYAQQETGDNQKTPAGAQPGYKVRR